MALKTHEIPVSTPCDERWALMKTSARGRHCAQCRTEVLDLSRMSEREVRAALARGDVCVRYEARADGTVLTANDRVLPASRLFAKVKPLLVAASTLLAPACGDVPETAKPASFSAERATPAIAEPRASSARTEAAPVACDVPAAPAQSAPPAAEADAGTQERRPPRPMIMGRYVRPHIADPGSEPGFGPGDF
jgi:hypothetical protein